MKYIILQLFVKSIKIINKIYINVYIVIIIKNTWGLVETSFKISWMERIVFYFVIKIRAISFYLAIILYRISKQ